MSTTTAPTHGAGPQDTELKGDDSHGGTPGASTPDGPNGASREGAGRRGRSARPKRLAGYAVLIIFAIIYLYPFLIQIATSFKSDPAATAHPLSLIPNPFDLGAWKRMFGGRRTPPCRS